MSELLSISDLERLTGRDRKDIAKKLEQLPFQPGPKNSKRYDSRAALEAIFGARSLHELQRQIEEANLDVTRKRAQKLAIENAVKEGQLVAIEDIASVVEREYAAVRAGFLALGNRLAKDLMALDSAVEIKNRIDSEVNSVLAELSADQEVDNEK